MTLCPRLVSAGARTNTRKAAAKMVNHRWDAIAMLGCNRVAGVSADSGGGATKTAGGHPNAHYTIPRGIGKTGCSGIENKRQRKRHDPYVTKHSRNPALRPPGRRHPKSCHLAMRLERTT